MFKKTRLWNILVSLLIFSLLLAACGGVGKMTPSRLAPRFARPASRPPRRPFATGAQLAVDELNAKGGILGKQVELLNMDGKSDPVTVGNVAKQMIDKGADAIIAPSDFDFGGPGEPRGSEGRNRRHLARRVLAAVRLGRSGRQAVHHVDVEHHDGRRDREYAYNTRAQDRLRHHRRLHRLHQEPEPLLHRPATRSWAARSSSRTRTRRVRPTSPRSLRASRPCLSSPT